MHDDIREIVVMTTTVGAMEDASALARELVEQGLAACVQLDAIAASIYRWDGAVRQEPEVRLTIKSIPERLAALRDFVAGRHPYDLPQITWTTMACTPEYGAWVKSAGR